MRTLVVSRDAPYPPRSGSPLRTWHTIRALATRGPVDLFSVGGREPDARTVPLVEHWEHVDHADFPRAAAAGLARVGKLLRPRQFPLENDGITGALNRRLGAFIARTRPDVIVLSHWVDALPDALAAFPRVVVDAHNIYSVLACDLILQRQPRLSPGQWLADLRFRRREARLFRRAQRVWVTSDDDVKLTARLDAALPAPVVWPNTVDVDSYAAVRDRTLRTPAGLARDGKTIVYVGYYVYSPNARAAELLIDEILPAVRARVPGARLLLVGRQPSPRMLAAAAADPGIVVTGEVADPRPYLAAADVCAVPLTEGGGTRLKIIEAFSAGIPVVSTSKGAQGLRARAGDQLAIADDPAALAAALADVLERPESYREQTRRAYELAREQYSWQALVPLLDGALPA